MSITRLSLSTFDDGTVGSWVNTGTPIDTLAVSTEQSFSGSYSLKTTGSGIAKLPYSIVSGRYYQIFARVYVGTAADAATNIRIQSFGGTSNVLSIGSSGGAYSSPSSSGEWESLVLLELATSTSSGFGLSIRLLDDTAVVYWDDIIVNELTLSSSSSYLTPIIENIQLILQARLNYELDLLGSSFEISSESIRIESPFLMPEQPPWICIFPDSENEVESRDQVLNMTVSWGIVVMIFISGTIDQDNIKNMDTYLTAMIKALVKAFGGTGWGLAGETRLLSLNSISYEDFQGQTETEIYKAGYLRLTVEDEYNPKA